MERVAAAGGQEGDVDYPQQAVGKLVKVLESLSGSMGTKKVEDLKKRILVMEGKWKDLNPEVRRGVDALAEDLARGDVAKAEKVQKTLMVDWPSLCGTWMVGVKHVIQESKKVHGCDKEEAAAAAAPVPEPVVMMMPVPDPGPGPEQGAF